MKYFYLIDSSDMSKNFSICFSNKKDMLSYAKMNCMSWYYVVNKKDIPPRIIRILGNNTCKDYNIKDDTFVIKDSLKDRRK